jgi:SEC-C motif domain protein
MRSRYSAYFFRLVDYLVITTHPDHRPLRLLAEVEEVANSTTWKFLEVLGASKGGKDDKTGKVEFIATYYVGKEERQHHEISRFRRHKGLWKYVDDKG